MIILYYINYYMEEENISNKNIDHDNIPNTFNNKELSDNEHLLLQQPQHNIDNTNNSLSESTNTNLTQHEEDFHNLKFSTFDEPLIDNQINKKFTVDIFYNEAISSLQFIEELKKYLITINSIEKVKKSLVEVNLDSTKINIIVNNIERTVKLITKLVQISFSAEDSHTSGNTTNNTNNTNSIYTTNIEILDKDYSELKSKYITTNTIDSNNSVTWVPPKINTFTLNTYYSFANFSVHNSLDNQYNTEKELIEISSTHKTSITHLCIVLKFLHKIIDDLIKYCETYMKKILASDIAELSLKFYACFFKFHVLNIFIVNAYKMTSDNLFNKSHNSKEWQRILSKTERVVLYSQHTMRQKTERIFDMIILGSASIHKSNQIPEGVLRSLGTGLFMTMFFFAKESANTQNLKFQTKPNLDVAQKVWNLLDTQGIKHGLELTLAGISNIAYRNKMYLKRTEPELNLDYLKFLNEVIIELEKNNVKYDPKEVGKICDRACVYDNIKKYYLNNTSNNTNNTGNLEKKEDEKSENSHNTSLSYNSHQLLGKNRRSDLINKLESEEQENINNQNANCILENINYDEIYNNKPNNNMNNHNHPFNLEIKENIVNKYIHKILCNVANQTNTTSNTTISSLNSLTKIPIKPFKLNELFYEKLDIADTNVNNTNFNITPIEQDYVKTKLLHSNSLYIPKIEKEAQSGFMNYLFGKCCAVPTRNKTRDAIVIHIHGGGFVAMSSSSHENYLRKWCNQLEVPFISIDYRLSPDAEYPKALDDVYQAYNWIVNCAEEHFNIELNKIILIGDSAGGNLACSLVSLLILHGKRVPNALFLIYSAINLDAESFSPSKLLCLKDQILSYHFLHLCFEAYFNRHNPGYPYKDVFASPAFLQDSILRLFPKTRLVVGTGDPTRDDQIFFLDRLLKNKVDAFLYEYKYFPHGFLNYDLPLVMPEAAELNKQILMELEKIIGSNSSFSNTGN